MGWSPGAVETREVIEVCPAATLIARSISASKYKGHGATARRAEILNALGVTLEDDAGAQAEAVDHVLDAVIACVAAADYVRGEVVAPEDLKVAKTEGWIWFKHCGGWS